MNPRSPIPPKRAERFLQWFIRDELAEEVLGDLEEKFYVVLEEKSLFRAQLNYWYQVIHYLRPFALKAGNLSPSNHFTMYRHYFKVSWRNLFRQKLYSFLNIGGLAVGLTCFLLIFLFVQHELSYDQFYPNSDQVYRIIQREEGNMFLGTDYFAITPGPLAGTLKSDFPEVVNATTIRDQEALLGFEDEHYWEVGLWADQHFFDVFPTSFLRGSPASALSKANNIVLTASMARKIFGHKDPMEEILLFDNEDSYVVTGVIPDPPLNSSLAYQFICSVLSNDSYRRQNWSNNSFHTFFVLAEGTEPEQLQNKLPALLETYRPREADYPIQDSFFVESLSDLHLQSNLNFDIGRKGNATYVYLFAAIALIVLLLACINYMNLAVARSINRAREVGMRKVIGAVRKQLIGQFLSEAVLIALLAFILALALTHLLLPVFGEFVERPLALNAWENPGLIPGLFALVITVGLISGSYPALFMSALTPIQVLSGKLKNQVSGLSLQKVLIVGQYVVSIVLISGSLIIYLQLQFIQEKELGYEKDHVIVVEVQDYSLFDSYQSLRDQWLTHPGITSVSTTVHLPTHIRSSNIANFDNGIPDDDVAIYGTEGGYDFLEVFGVKLLTGRNFSRSFTTDEKEACLINETAAKAFGWTPEEALGKQFTSSGLKTVVGVVKDFHMHSMHMDIEPLVISLNENYFRYFAIKTHPEKVSETLAFLESSLGEVSPYPFDYQFLDEHFDQLYKTEMRMGETFGFFTLVALLIASLGLFGLAAFATEQRTREIGIRKVLGASVRHVLAILTRDFLGLVLVATGLAIPIGWYVMEQWLQDFAFRIEIEWWIFAATFLLILSISVLTISYQSIRAALANPVESLRSE